MASAFDSPDTVQLKGKVTGVTKLSRKAKSMMMLVAGVVVMFILFSIASMEDDTAPKPAPAEGEQVEDAEKPPEIVPAKPNFEHVGNGQAGIAAVEKQNSLAGQQGNLGGIAATANGGQEGQNVGPGYNLGQGAPAQGGATPKLSPQALGAAPGARGNMAEQVNQINAPAGAAAPPQQTPQEIETLRVAKAKADAHQKAISAPLEMGGGDGLSMGGGMGTSAAMKAGLDAQSALLAAAAAQAGTGGQGGLGQGFPALGTGSAQQDDPNKQARKEKFLKENEAPSKTSLKSSVREPQSPYEVQAGWAIPAQLQCGVNSDLPGQTCARVSEDVFDSVSGEHLLIPRNSRLIGTYDSQVAYGQTSILTVFHRVIFPDGSSIDLQGMPGANKGGYAGFDANVNNHYGKVFGGAAAMAALSASVSLTQKQPTNTNGVQTNSQVITQSLGQQLGQTGTAFIQRGMNVQATLSRDPGYKFNVMVTRDITFSGPYTGKR
jgi:type IV secretory pathway VirB10-like protein